MAAAKRYTSTGRSEVDTRSKAATEAGTGIVAGAHSDLADRKPGLANPFTEIGNLIKKIRGPKKAPADAQGFGKGHPW